ncbi:hypothetical protein QEZ54_16620 [Catellatospora sp. KI3]|uniref:DUF624 domain-containing protein n=1 Tax=Catellatospora sp. KI3 TaxID=3041620 RepID=UPI0024827D77|nr:DUF624 domain-containing protein [Catellatospora sp. KI3]MDI1462598.1 hypothetical protein [Catellatospora sp. KI3]
MRLLARLPYDTIFNTVYAGLKLNLCLLAACSPLLLALAASREPLSAWPFFTALAALCGPAVRAAFATFAGLAEGDDRVARTFLAAYRTSFGRSLGVAAVAAALVIVLAADFQLALGGPFGAVTPLLALLIALVVATAVAALTAAAPVRPKPLLACAYLSLRHWYLTLVNLAVLAVLAAAVVTRPALGLFLLPAPALYLVWANTRHLTHPHPLPR